MPTTEPDPDLIPMAEAIERYKLSRSTIERAIRRTELTPYRKTGVNGRLLDVAELDKLTAPKPAHS